jgi:1-phosphatidylinositol-3-phosphate 5-kinase
MPTSKPPVNTPSPAASVSPASRLHSRRTSTASALPPPDQDKDNFLDHIHTTASRSDALTTFDDFAPQRPGSKSEAKTFAGDVVQSGLSGLYSRLKASVGAAKDAVAGSTGNDSADDASVRSGSTKVVPPKSSATTALTSSTTASTSSSRIQSPLTANFHESLSVSAQSMVAPSSGNAQLRSGLQSLDTSNSTARTGSSNGESRSPEDTRQTLSLGQSVGSASSPIMNPVRQLRKRDKSVDGEGRGQSLGPSLSKTDSRTPYHAMSNTQPEPFRAERQGSDAGSAFTDRSGLDNDPERTPKSLTGRVDRPKPTQESSSSTLKPFPRPINTQNAPTFQEPHMMSNFKSDSGPDSYSDYSRPPLIQVSQSHLPGYRANDSSDGDLSSVATAVVPTRRPVYSLLESPGGPQHPHVSHDNTSRMRNKILAKELWMRDENAKDCFYCGDAFSAFRRKHHCRECSKPYCSCTPCS